MRWEKVVVEIVGSWARRSGARTGFPPGPCLLYTMHSGRLALVLGPGGGGGSGSTGEAEEVRLANPHTHIPANWVKEQVATTNISSNTSMMVGRALLNQVTSHGPVGIGAEVVVVVEGGPTLGARGLVLVLVGEGMPGVVVGVAVVGEVVVVPIEDWCTGEGVREPTATARPRRALSTSRVGELSVVADWLDRGATKGVDRSRMLVVVGAVIADWLGKEASRGVGRSEVLVVVEIVVADWSDRGAARGVDRSKVLVVVEAVVADWLDRGAARGVDRSEVLALSKLWSQTGWTGEPPGEWTGPRCSSSGSLGRRSAAGGILHDGSQDGQLGRCQSLGIKSCRASEPLADWLEALCWGVYWAGWRIALTTSARNCSSPVGVPGRPF